MTTTNTPPPPPPDGSCPSGVDLWNDIVKAFDLDQHELSLLTQAVGTLNVIDTLEASVAELGPMLTSSQGDRVNPAIGELRQQRIALARLLGALRLPSGDDNDMRPGSRPSRRTGVRGTYRTGSVS